MKWKSRLTIIIIMAAKPVCDIPLPSAIGTGKPQGEREKVFLHQF